MTTYRLVVNNRNYEEWELLDTGNHGKVSLTQEFNPVEQKLFTNDIISIGASGNIEIMDSPIRKKMDIPCVLILKGNKTYGRVKDKYLYKCIPNDTNVPPFLVPYEIKNIGFSKVFHNLYVTIKFNEWTQRHPCGVLNQVIGPIHDLPSFYEYQLYCKDLNVSINKMNKEVKRVVESKNMNTWWNFLKESYPNIEERKEDYIFTIDPKNSSDLDDGFSIKTINQLKKISIYISNVVIWLDMLELWEAFSSRISTIYLPDKKRSMLPTMLSEQICSLKEKEDKVVFVMDIYVDVYKCEIVNIEYSNAVINVTKNFDYEDVALLNNPYYMDLMNTIKKIEHKYPYLQSVSDSHDLVSYLMIMMNYNCALELRKYKSGVFRSLTLTETKSKQNIPEHVQKYIQLWNSSSGKYVNGENYNAKEKTNNYFSHDLMKLETYLHITSPIRRLVDVLNLIKIQKHLGLIKYTDKMDRFYEMWLKKLDMINSQMISIRKIQSDSFLLDLCNTKKYIMDKEHEGYIVEMCEEEKEGYNKYTVFLTDLKLFTKIKTREKIDNYEKRMFKLFLFQDEANFKKKVRLQLSL